MSDPQLPPVDPDEIEDDHPEPPTEGPAVAGEGAALLATPVPPPPPDDTDADEDSEDGEGTSVRR